MATIDSDYVKQMATQLASYEVQASLAKANRNEAAYKAQLEAVNSLDSALKAFGSSIKGMKGSTSNMLVNSATFGKEGYATAKVGATAVAGSYEFFVEQLATSHQLAVQGLAAGDIDTQGTLSIAQNGKSFAIDLAAIDKDGDGQNSLEELAAAINGATGNTGVKASLVRANGQVSLVLGAEKSGAANAIGLSVSGTSGTAFAGALANATELSAARDARVRLGGEGGMLLTNASNTFDNLIEGVSMTFTQAHKSGEQPLSVSIAQDKDGTKGKVQAFIDAFNALMTSFDSLTASGGANGSTRGALAGDSSVRSIETMLNGLVRSAFGGKSLMSYGIAADRNGKLTLDVTRFEKALAADPEGLEKLFLDKGNLLDSVDKSLAAFTNSTGLMKTRKEAINASLARIDNEFETIQKHYDSYYSRYLRQYTSLMQTMSAMDQTGGLFA